MIFPAAKSLLTLFRSWETSESRGATYCPGHELEAHASEGANAQINKEITRNYMIPSLSNDSYFNLAPS